jgi:hypothetical protein
VATSEIQEAEFFVKIIPILQICVRGKVIRNVGGDGFAGAVLGKFKFELGCCLLELMILDVNVIERKREPRLESNRNSGHAIIQELEDLGAIFREKEVVLQYE